MIDCVLVVAMVAYVKLFAFGFVWVLRAFGLLYALICCVVYVLIVLF